MQRLAAFVACGWLGAAIAAQAPPPALPSVYIEDLTWPEVRAAVAAGKTTAIIYAGSTEQNGPHMALGKHNFVAHYVAGEIAKKLGNALVYPTMPFAPTGSSELRTGHMRFPGSVSISDEMFFGVIRQVAQSALAAGFKNVFIMGDPAADRMTCFWQQSRWTKVTNPIRMHTSITCPICTTRKSSR